MLTTVLTIVLTTVLRTMLEISSTVHALGMLETLSVLRELTPARETVTTQTKVKQTGISNRTVLSHRLTCLTQLFLCRRACSGHSRRTSACCFWALRFAKHGIYHHFFHLAFEQTDWLLVCRGPIFCCRG